MIRKRFTDAVKGMVDLDAFEGVELERANGMEVGVVAEKEDLMV